MDDILKLGSPSTYTKGSILLQPGDPGDVIFYILSGAVKVYTLEQSQEKNVQIIYGPGDVFSITWIIIQKPLNIYYEAVEDCEVVRIPQSALEQLLLSNPHACYEMLKQVTRQFILYKARVDNLEYKYARERVAYRLLLLGRKFGTESNEQIVMQRFSQSEIANAINVSRENVSREISRMERLGYIAYEGNHLKILQPSMLRQELAAADTPLFIDDL